MKKLFLFGALAIITNTCVAGYNEDLVATILKSGAPTPISVEKTIVLQSFNNVRLSLVKINNDYSPILASSDGKSIVGFSQFMLLSESDMLAYKKLIQELQSKSNAKTIPLLKTIPNSSVLTIESFSKKPKSTFFIVSDPECPFCREDLLEIEKRLADSNVKIIFAPVHEKSSLVKSALILKESSGTQEEKIKILKKYYDENMVLSPNTLNTNTSSIEKNVDSLIKSKAIKGVPFIAEETHE